MSESVFIEEQRKLVVIQRNPHAGTASKQRKLARLIDELKRCGLVPRLFSSRERLDRWLRIPENTSRVRCIVAAGGDGTVQDLINRHPILTMGLFPIGTENVLARYLGIPQDPVKVAAMIAQGGTRLLDLGCREERRFTLMASAGFDAEVISRAHKARRGHTSRWQYLWPIARTLWNAPGPILRVSIDEHPVRTARMVVVVNVPRYALGLNMATHALDDDGWLEVRLFKNGSAWQMCWYFVHLCFGTHERLRDVESFQGKEVLIESGIPIAAQIDGDPAGLTPLKLTVLPRALRIIVPSVGNSTQF